MKILIVLLVFFSAQLSQAQNSDLIRFNLEDQFNRKYTEKSWSDNILIIIGSDKDGSQYSRSWGKAISNSLRNDSGIEKISIVRLADLRSVPFFLKEYVKGTFSEEKESWVLMDWDGLIPKTYQFDSKVSNILIFNHDRTLAHKAAVQELDPQELEKIVGKLRALIIGKKYCMNT